MGLMVQKQPLMPMDFGVIYRTRWNGNRFHWQPTIGKAINCNQWLNGWKATTIGANGMPMNFGETSNGLNGLAIDFDSSDPLHWY